ncbi:MAG: MFS transporter [Ktedonobacteraceae bacterium]
MASIVACYGCSTLKAKHMDLHAAQHRLTIREQLLLSVLWFSLNVQSAALLPIVIPTQILLFIAPGQIGNAQQAAFLGWLSTMGAIVSLLVPPVIGMFSDHTTSAFGRRRPYIVAGSLFLLMSAWTLMEARNVIIFVLGLTIYLVGNNSVTAAYQGMLPDRVPKEQRGEASGYLGLMTILGNVVSLGLAAWLFSQVNLNSVSSGVIENGAGVFYILTAIILLVGVLITVAGVHEAPYVPTVEATSQTREAFRPRFHHWFERNWIEPWRDYNFMLVFLTRFSVMMGLALFLTFIEYYFADVVHNTNFVQATAAIAILALVGAVFSAFFLGIYSDRMRRAPVVCAATICMALAALAFVIFNGNFPLWPLGILFGLGYGAYTSVDWALSIDALPSLSTVGKDLGLWTASSTLPAIIAPALGGLIISLANVFGQTALGYRMVFAVATVFLSLGAVFILKVRERQEIRPVLEGTASAAKVNVPVPHASRRNIGFGWRLAFQTRAGKARGFLLFWPVWEYIYQAFMRIQPLPHAPNKLLAVRYSHYHGKPMILPGGERIGKGDAIIDLHFHNRTLMQAASQVSSWRLMHMMIEDMYALAVWVQSTEFPTEPKAVFAVTLMSRGAPRMGFTLRDRPHTLYNWLDRFFMTGLLVLYNAKGTKRLLQGTTYGQYPQEVWMSRDELLRRYGDSSTPEA